MDDVFWERPELGHRHRYMKKENPRPAQHLFLMQSMHTGLFINKKFGFLGFCSYVIVYSFMLENSPICRLVYVNSQLGVGAAMVRNNPFESTSSALTFWMPAR